MKPSFAGRRGIALWVLAAVLLLLAAWYFGSLRWEKMCTGGLFSWDENVIQEEPEALLGLMTKHGLSELYQYFPSDAETGDLEAFLTQAAEQGVSVYVLTGEPEWGAEANGASLGKVLARVARWNRELPEGSRFDGVMCDIEPYLLEEWEDEESRARLMQRYVQGYRTAYAQACENNLELIACIPYFFDSKGFTEELRLLTAEGCHRLAVMNYYRDKEIDHLRTEAALARQYGKGILTIYELQPSGIHGLTEKNTYYHLGLDALAENYRALRKAFRPQRVDYALHSYPLLWELTEREEEPHA